jgi:glycyl-tRNA synthetase beta chain
LRPLQSIVALLGDDVVPCEIEGIASGRTTMGHRFHSSGAVTIANAGAYVEALRAAHVIVHFSERCTLIRDGAAKAAADAGLVLVEDEGLVVENAGLTEWPVPMLGRFDPAFLDVPQEVIQLTARVNQKYFICREPGFKKLANAFVCTANIVAHDGGAAIVAGNEKVLAARLSDAKFFWEQDLKVRLEDQAAKLSNIVFHEKLGTVADKVERVAKLARWLCETGVVKSSPPRGEVARSDGGAVERPSGIAEADTPLHRSAVPLPASGEDLATLAERAARLCKADLVTGMVGEFPELQGIMGGYYARAQGEADAVADAIRDHYKPVGQGDDVPTDPVTVAVSLADKLDTLFGFFSRSMKPTGSKDPFALRRAAIGSLDVIFANRARFEFRSFINRATLIGVSQLIERAKKIDPKLVEFSLQAVASGNLVERIQSVNSEKKTGYSGVPIRIDFDPGARSILVDVGNLANDQSKNSNELLDFFADRLKVQQREAGVRHDLIDAVFALGGEDDLVRLLARVKALQGFITTPEGANLLAGYKRAANILKSSPPRGEVARSDGGEVERPSGIAEVDAPLHRSAVPLPVNGEELALEQALDAAEPLAAAAIEAEQFEQAMAALATLRAPIDAFFDGVMVNDPDPDKRAYRMGLLSRFRDAVHRVADFSKIEG